MGTFVMFGDLKIFGWILLAKFLNAVTELKVGTSSIGCWDWEGVWYSFANLKEFRGYCEEVWERQRVKRTASDVKEYEGLFERSIWHLQEA